MSPPLARVLSQINPVHTFQSYFLKTTFVTILPDYVLSLASSSIVFHVCALKPCTRVSSLLCAT
jgi:hypothetical protein